MINVPNTLPHRVLSFVRRNERDKVFAVLNAVFSLFKANSCL
jgi:hypothetical protein